MLGSPALPIGSLIAQKYRVEEVLGQGGFGITYLAFDTALEHYVAIKELFPEGSTRQGHNVIPPPNLNFAETKQKFLEEAKVVQRFTHRNIVRVYGTLEEHHTAYIVMEALTGSTLGADVASNGPFPEKIVLEMARQLCDALETVHAAGLLHRDIKPDNVFLSSDARVVLIDFGSARGFMQGQVRRVTRLVTPGYAAPEQYASQAAFGAYTDVYGLAATLYHAVEGVMPPAATDLMLGTKLEFQKSGRMRAALEEGLKVKVGERPATIADFKAELGQTNGRLRTGSSLPVSRLGTVDEPFQVLEWNFDSNGFSSKTKAFLFHDIRAVKMKPVVRDDLGIIGLIIFLIAFSSFIAGLIISSGLLLLCGGFAVFVFIWLVLKYTSENQNAFHYYVNVVTHHGQELVARYYAKNNALLLGQTIAKHSKLNLEIEI
jgi:serine/threonine protein kinase